MYIINNILSKENKNVFTFVLQYKNILTDFGFIHGSIAVG